MATDGLRVGKAFADLTDEELADLKAQVSIRSIAKGEALVEQGQLPAAVYVILSGLFDVHFEDRGTTSVLAQLERGDLVGEIAIVSGDVRTSTVRAARAGRVVELTREGFLRLLDRRSDIAERLAGQSASRLRHQRLQHYLVEAFPNVEPEVLAQLCQGVEWESIASGRVLFAQGDVADRAYVVVSGRLRASNAHDGHLAELGPGRLVGEAALAASGRRVATVRALRDTELAVVTRATLERLAKRHPRAMLELLGAAIQDQHRVVDGQEINIVLVPVGDVDLGDLTSRLVEELSVHGSLAYADSSVAAAALGIDDASEAQGLTASTVAIEHWLSTIEEAHDTVLFLADDTWTPWTRRCMRRADRVVFVADAGDDPSLRPIESLSRNDGASDHVHQTLLLLHPPEAQRPRRSATWLAPRSVQDHLHVRRGDAADHARVGRLLAGKAIALVLGGGGARGFAHLGVIQALRERGVPVDLVYGTSIGAVMGAMAAMQFSDEQARDTIRRSFHKQLDVTLPMVALLKGRKITETIDRELGDWDIEDTWVPYRCVVTNLTTADSMLRERGSLARAVRASVAIPGILPPVADRGDLLIDGGVLDNLPIGRARQNNDCGVVIAVDVTPPSGPRAREHFEPAVSGWGQATRSALPGLRSPRIPSLSETITSTTIIGSRRQNGERITNKGVDLQLSLDLKGVSLLEFSSEAVDRVAERGHRTSLPQLDAYLADERSAGVPRGAPEVVSPSSEAAAAVGPEEPRQLAAELRGALVYTALDLRHRARRFLVATVMTSVVFTLLLLMTGLSQQLSREADVAMDVLGGEQWIIAEDAGGPFTSARTVDPAAVPGADPVLLARFSLAGTAEAEPQDVIVVGGVDVGTPTVGRAIAGPREAIVGSGEGHAVGDTLVVGDVALSIVGEVEDATLFAGVPLLVMSLEDARDVVYDGRPVATALLGDGEVEVPAGYRELTARDVAQDTARPLERPIASVNLVRMLLWVVAGMIVGAVVYLTSLDRSRDVAVLLAVGTPARSLILSLIVQAVVMAGTAAVVAAALQAVIKPLFPLAVHITTANLVELPIVAAVVAVLASTGGIRRTLKTDPARAFAGPGG